jgi:isoquinoline 1-oxidoreductase alpha subunit
MSIAFTLNGASVKTDVDPDMPLLWYLRDHARLTGTKFGCGVGACGACTVHFNGAAARSCQLPLRAVAGGRVTTIEGIGTPDHLHPVQQAWIDEDVPQCGYCQVGQIMAAVALLQRTPSPVEADIAGLTNLCRCGTYPRIRRAIRRAAGLRQESAP